MKNIKKLMIFALVALNAAPVHSMSRFMPKFAGMLAASSAFAVSAAPVSAAKQDSKLVDNSDASELKPMNLKSEDVCKLSLSTLVSLTRDAYKVCYGEGDDYARLNSLECKKARTYRDSLEIIYQECKERLAK